MNATYAPHGELATVLNGYVSGGFAGITYARTYNNRLQVTRIQATSANGTALDLSYSYDQGNGINNSNVVSETNNKSGQSGRSQSFTYDYLNRVTSAQTQATSGANCWALNFTYDRYGNLLSETEPSGYSACSVPQSSWSVNANNQINGDTYDAAGNLTHDTHSYTHDAKNRLSTAFSGSITYLYDADNWRVQKSDGEIAWYDPTCAHSLSDIFDLSGNLKTEYYYVGGLMLASRSFFYYSDRLGSVRVMTDSTGNVQFESDYYPFGGEEIISGTNSTDTEQKFTGKHRDWSNTGFDYSHLRMYNSAMGRWLQADPINGKTTDPQTLNRYNYVRNNAANLVDPTGGFERFIEAGDDTQENTPPNLWSRIRDIWDDIVEVHPLHYRCFCHVDRYLKAFTTRGEGCWYYCDPFSCSRPDALGGVAFAHPCPHGSRNFGVNCKENVVFQWEHFWGQIVDLKVEMVDPTYNAFCNDPNTRDGR